MRKTAAVVLSLILVLMLSLNALAFTIVYDGKSEDYPWEPITLTLDGQKIETDEMPPIILNGRTLVPAREFFEQLGAEVRWVQASKRVVINYDSRQIILSIDSRTVFIGDRAVTIPEGDPAPKIVNDKTMIPVRLVAEEFGFGVEWINNTRTVAISSPKNDEWAITKIRTDKSNNDSVIYVYADRYVEPQVFKLQNPERIVFDFYAAEAEIDDGSIDVQDSMIDQVRYSQHDGKFRIVADVNCAADYYIEEFSRGIAITLVSSGEISAGSDIELDNPGDYIVVIDAGHGGSDPGAMFPNRSENPEIREKDVTLDIARKVNSILKSNGINVIMTRTADTYPTLPERVEIANNAKADLFVAIHCNAMESQFNIDGAQVYYYGGSDFGKQFATIVYDNIVEYTGMTKRGIQDGSSLYVIKHTNMPAILTEGGFVSNEKDRAYLLSEQGRAEIANAIADGIMEALTLL